MNVRTILTGKLVPIACTILFVAYMAWQLLPGIYLNNRSMGMIQHFDGDESVVISGARNIVHNPLGFPKKGPYYPMLYYYLVAGLMTPVFALKALAPSIIGPDAGLAFLLCSGIRTGNALSFLALLVLLMIFSRRFFDSWTPGVVAGFLTLFSPICYGFIVNSRPDFFEVLMITAALGCFGAYLSEQRPHYLLTGVLLAGVSFNVKFDGICLFPLSVWLLYRALKRGHVRFRTVGYSVLYMTAATAVLLATTVAIFARQWTARGKTFGQLMESEVARILMGSNILQAVVPVLLIAIGLLTLLVLLLHFFSRDGEASPFRTVLIRLGVSVVAVALVYLVLFLLTNPYFIFDPLHSAGFVRRFIPLLHAGAHTGYAINFVEKLTKGSRWFLMLFDARMMGTAAGTMVTVGAAWVFFRLLVDRRNPNAAGNLLCVFFGYIAFKFALLVVLVDHMGHNFLLANMVFLYMAFGYFIYTLNKKAWQALAVGLLALAVIPGIGVQMSKVNFRSSDSVHQVSQWLKTHADKGNKIMVDVWPYYVPSEFKKLKWKAGAPGHLENQRPEFFIRTDALPNSVDTVEEDRRYLETNYHEAQRFPNDAYPHSAFNETYAIIYARNN